MRPQQHSSRRFLGLYQGEVLAVILPDDEHSVTKQFLEYRVAAQVAENGTVATVEFAHALLANPLAGLADRAAWTLRADPKSGQKGQPGLGSKVVVACLGGDRDSAVILSGLRDDRDDGDDPEAGRHLDLVFNGVAVSVDDDGALTVTRNGVIKDDGSPDTDASPEDAVGAFVTLDSAGGIRVATVRGQDKDGAPQEEQSIFLDHDASELTVTSKSGVTIKVVEGPCTVEARDDVAVTSHEGDVVVTAEAGDVTHSAPKGKVKLGGGADQPVPLGDDLVAWLKDLCQALQQLTVGTGTGPSSPPLNAPAFAQLAQRGQQLLSGAASVAKDP